MPIYDYTCSACRHLTEVIHGMYDHGPRFCPECGAEGTMTKGFTAPAIHFKGTGWAKKDRGSALKASSKSAEEAGSSKESVTKESADGAAPDSKSAPAADTKPAGGGDPASTSSATPSAPSTPD